MEPRNRGSLILLPRPDRPSPHARISWPVIMEIFARSRSPVALVPQAPATPA